MNTYWRHGVVYSRERKEHFAVTYVSKEGKAYAEQLRQVMMDRRAWYYSEEPIHLRMLVCFQQKREDQDVDNRIKPLLDAFAFAGVYKNDRQVKAVEAREGPILKPAVCFVWMDEFIPDPMANLRWIQNPVG